MFNPGLQELLLVLVVALVVVGPSRLPEIARTLGRLVGRARRANENFLDLTRDIGRYTHPDDEQAAASEAPKNPPAPPQTSDAPDASASPAPPASPYTSDAPDASDASSIRRQLPDDASKP